MTAAISTNSDNTGTKVAAHHRVPDSPTPVRTTSVATHKDNAIAEAPHRTMQRLSCLR
jgi:hypothetical protein